MKNILIIIPTSFLLLFVNILCCSSQSDSVKEKDNSGTNFVTGKILMAQNEPFTELALVTDNSVYLLDCPDEIKEIIYNNQGKTAKVYYSNVSKNEESVRVLQVDKVEIINSNSND